MFVASTVLPTRDLVCLADATLLVLLPCHGMLYSCWVGIQATHGRTPCNFQPLAGFKCCFLQCTNLSLLPTNIVEVLSQRLHKPFGEKATVYL